ncbi:MAG: glycosyltransferase [Candidatus Helarchaeota archaeon]|nr:glycosyltransferase [Candidatus Helarchaeota archaeon]
MKPIWILYLSTFPPKVCGIASFTKDLTAAMGRKFSSSIKSKVVALNDIGTNFYNYPEDVIFEINDNDISSYIDIAKKINAIDAIKLINVQHEFGIFGGKYGEFLIKFLENVKKPVVITLHSTIPNPGNKLKKVVRSLAEKSSCLVVMAKKGMDILREDYEIETDIIVIPHGTPTVPFNLSLKEKKAMGFGDKIILSSFGLMNPGKGYEYVIEALPEVIKRFPNVLYFIIGKTHPVVKRKEGEGYRNFLEEKVKELDLQKHVKFNNNYVPLEEIIKILKATDIYISSGLNPNQIVSGTLAYAMSCGKMVISSAFLHAKDAITPDRGILVEFKDSKAFARAIIKVLSNPDLKERMEKNIYSYTRYTTWPNVLLAYFNLFITIIGESVDYKMSFPKIKFSYIKKLTDDFGMLQFANYTNPDKLSGYTLDDNARALLDYSIHYNIFIDDAKLKLIKKYLDFIKFVQQNDNKMYNFVDHNRKVNLESWSEDSHGRAMWALGYLVFSKNISNDLRIESQAIFEKGLKAVNNIKSPRAVAFIIIGLYFYNQVKKSNSIQVQIKKLSNYLISLYFKCSYEEWNWFEKNLTYSNSKLPEALFYSYKITGEEKYLKIAIDSLNFLISITFKDDLFSPVGQNGWYIKDGHKTFFDQQPVDTSSMVQTLILAYKITKEKKYMKFAILAFEWFLGKNSLNQVIYDETTGGCYDGLGEFSINLNQGAESSVTYLLARLAFEEFKKNG